MPNKMKQKGTRWENEAIAVMNEVWGGGRKRIPGSGALGTIVDIPGLTGDVTGRLFFFPYQFRGECKVGYGGKEMTVRKEWFDKIRDESEKNYGNLPCVLLKFEKSWSGVKYVIAFDFDAFNLMMSEMQKIYNENVELRKERAEKE